MSRSAWQRPEPFSAKLSLPAEGAVILLGAGASTCVGAPLMRGFIDRARDYSKLGLFTADVLGDVKATVEFYDSLRSHFRITEEDIENVENLLSLAELADLIPNLPFSDSLPPRLSDSIRRFVEAVLVKAVRLPAPNSPLWLGLNGGPAHKRIVAALAHYREKITVITLNYDCVLEYACHCMGVPFTYHRAYGEGVEILKLHGSINWLSCRQANCKSRGIVRISELRYQTTGDGDTGTVEPAIQQCPDCSSPLRPHIVPPTWGKQFDDKAFQESWARAVDVLSSAETLVSIDDNAFQHEYLQLLPLPTGPSMDAGARKSLEAKQREHNVWRDEFGLRGIDFVKVAQDLRGGKPAVHEPTTVYRQILCELGLDWVPTGPILPVHGSRLARPL